MGKPYEEICQLRSYDEFDSPYYYEWRYYEWLDKTTRLLVHCDSEIRWGFMLHVWNGDNRKKEPPSYLHAMPKWRGIYATLTEAREAGWDAIEEMMGRGPHE